MRNLRRIISPLGIFATSERFAVVTLLHRNGNLADVLKRYQGGDGPAGFGDCSSPIANGR
jgi:hypothetical protein